MLLSIAKRKMFVTDSVTRFIFPMPYGISFFNFASNVPQQLPDTVPILKPVNQSSSSAALKIKTISKAMKAYLERSRKHEDFLQSKNEEFERGKLHLANMMGLDACTLTQDDIDKAIAYLFPSGLYEKHARPLMKPPIKLFPKEKAAQFDDSGRPFSPFFYTKYPNYFNALHTLALEYQNLNDLENKMLEKGVMEPPDDLVLNMSAGEWLKMTEIQSMFLEKISEDQYNSLITTLNRLAGHPYSFQCKDELWKFRREFTDLGSQEAILPLYTDENGRPFMEAKGTRKHCIANVVVRGSGTGKITINGTDIFHFERLQDREQIMYPLHFCDMLGQVDVEVDVQGPGPSAQAGAIRLAIALCLRSFVSPDLVDKMRIGGLLTVDLRRRGRKKPGQKGNRAKYTWKKR